MYAKARSNPLQSWKTSRPEGAAGMEDNSFTTWDFFSCKRSRTCTDFHTSFRKRIRGPTRNISHFHWDAWCLHTQRINNIIWCTTFCSCPPSFVACFVIAGPLCITHLPIFTRHTFWHHATVYDLSAEYLYYELGIIYLQGFVRALALSYLCNMLRTDFYVLAGWHTFPPLCLPLNVLSPTVLA